MNVKRYRFYLLLLLLMMLLCGAFSLYYIMNQDKEHHEGILVQSECVLEGDDV